MKHKAAFGVKSLSPKSKNKLIQALPEEAYIMEPLACLFLEFAVIYQRKLLNRLINVIAL